MNKELLMRLYSLHSPSGSEKKMRRFIRKQALDAGASAVTDSFGNLLVTKGVADTYPCLASHMDQVQRKHSADFACGEINGMVFGCSKKSRERQGLGADDKNGIWICLECLKKYDVIKCVFFVGEEVGCTGSSKINLSFFNDCRFIVEPDRRGSSDLITSMFCGGVCSDDFISDIHPENFGYKKAVGSVTDVGTLTERKVGISCLNLSCGYYDAHSDSEFTILSELENCLHFVESIIENCKDVYPFIHVPIPFESKYAPSSHTYYGNYYKYNFCNRYDDDWLQMYDIVRSNPYTAFDDLVTEYDGYFESDKETLRTIYDDVCAEIIDEGDWGDYEDYDNPYLHDSYLS